MAISRIETNSIAPSQTLTTPIIATTMGVGGATPSGSGSGITFPATQSASSDVNTLDDYEEGTFTPTVYGTSTAGTATYTNQYGRYTKIGNRVFFDLSVYWNSGTGTGSLRINGLPFTSAGGGNCMVGSDNLALTISNFTSFSQVQSSQVYMEIYQNPIGGGNLTNVAYDAAANVWISGTYFTST